MTQKYFYPAVFQPEEKGYSVYVPDIPGCCTEGLSMPEAIAMAEDAIGLMLEGVKKTFRKHRPRNQFHWKKNNL